MKDFEEFESIFCDNVRWLRKFRGLSKSEMAELIGVTSDLLDRIEAGELPPEADLETLWKMQCTFKTAIYIFLEYRIGELYEKITPDFSAAMLELLAVYDPRKGLNKEKS